MKTFYLFKSDKTDKKFVMLMPTFKHTHYFGGAGYRDYTLMNDKTSKFYEPSKEEKDKVKKNYLKRHSKEPKGIHTPSSMSDIILWNKTTLVGGIKAFENKFNVKIIYKNTKLTKEIKNKIMKK